MVKKNKKRLKSNRPPLGMLCGILAACFATLIGVFSGLEPFVILCRAFVSAVILGMLVSLGTTVIEAANVKPRKPNTNK